jgi:hypothetical protein
MKLDDIALDFILETFGAATTYMFMLALTENCTGDGAMEPPRYTKIF